MTLTEFLLARIAEDEDEAKGATLGQWERDSGWSVTAPPPEGWSGPYVIVDTKVRNDAWFIARFNPTRVLAECEAKRRIVERATGGDGCGGHPGPYMPHGDYGTSYCFRADEDNWDLRDLAMPYTNHPDYLPEWKP
jgi:hypothetical protein